MGTKLEEISIEKRNEFIMRNYFNSTDESKMYSSTHTKALSDELTPIQGKGTGIAMGTHSGGSMVDINGNPNVPGSGRLGNVSYNQYSEGNGYTTPDTSGNVGQVNID